MLSELGREAADATQRVYLITIPRVLPDTAVGVPDRDLEIGSTICSGPSMSFTSRLLDQPSLYETKSGRNVSYSGTIIASGDVLETVDVGDASSSIVSKLGGIFSGRK